MQIKLRFAFVFFILCVAKQIVAQAPNFIWAKNAVGINAEGGDCITVDGNGNVFVAGHFYSSTITFGTYTLTSNGNYDIYIVKYDPLGNVLWAKGGGGIYHDLALGVVTDANGNAYLTGCFYSPSVTLGAFTLTTTGGGDAFIIKYDPSGNEMWAQNIGGKYDDNGNGIAADQSGNIYVTGFFQSDTLVCGTFTLTNTGSSGDVFIAKYNNSGTVIWARSLQGATNDIGNGITVDLNENVYITGEYYSPSLIIDTFTLTNAGSNDAFIAKFNPLGNTLWAKSAGGSFNDIGYEISLDQFGNVFMGGDFNSPSIVIDTFTFTNAGNFDFFISKYDASGNTLWAKTEGDVMDEVCTGLATDIEGALYVTGHYHGPSVSLGTYTLINNGMGGDLYLSKYNTSGNVIWATSAGGTNDDGSSALVTDPAGNVYVTGYFASPTITCSPYTLTNTGNGDMFVGKLETTVITNISKELKTPGSSILVYPNPSAGTFQLINNNLEILEIEIFNDAGELIYKSKYASGHQSTINISNERKGLYFLKIKCRNEIAVKKIMIN